MRKIKLHFNRVNMARRKTAVWSAHTSVACNQADEVVIMHGDKIIGKTVFNPDGVQPRAYVQFYGDVTLENGSTIVRVAA